MADKTIKLEKTTLARIIREEATKLVLEQKKDSFEEWAVKLLNKEYPGQVPASINSGNVISFLQGSKFKLSPEEFEARKSLPVSQASLMHQFKNRDSGASIPDREEVAASTASEEEDEKANYRQGEVKLADIGQELGMTKMGALKKIDAATEKIKSLSGDDVDPAVVNARIEAARLSAAKDYLAVLNGTRGNINAFLKALESTKLVKLANDVGDVTQREKDGLKELYISLKQYGVDIATEMLISDLEEEPAQRIWNTFQAAVARRVHSRKNAVGRNEED